MLGINVCFVLLHDMQSCSFNHFIRYGIKKKARSGWHSGHPTAFPQYFK